MPNITVTLAPSGVNSIGAKWCIEGVTNWLDSGDSYNVSAGAYVIQYRPVEGYQTPADAAVTMVATPLTPTGTYVGDAWVSTWKPPISMCIFRGQVICAGVKHTAPEYSVADSRIVRWSEIGAFRFLGGTAQAMRNEAGEYYHGTSNMESVMRVLPLKNGVMVYGSYSSDYIEPVSQPVPSFSISKEFPIGIANPLAVAGDDSKHLLVDRNGSLVLITYGQNGAIADKDIGYSDIFSAMQSGLSMATGTGIISVVYNKDDDEFYISDGLSSYLFNDLGLTRIKTAVAAYVNVSKSLMSAGWATDFTTKPLSVTTAITTGNYAYNYFETDIIDFNMNAVKTITGVEVAGAIGSGEWAEVMVKWRNTSSGAFSSSSWFRCSPGGVMKAPVSGRDFKICYRTPFSTSVEVNGVTVEWQLSDKTSVRGNYTNVSSLTSKSN